MSKIRIGVIFGGGFEEHPVSIKSAQEIADHLDHQRYDPYFIGITESGAWILCDGPGSGWETGDGHPVLLSSDRSAPGLLVREPSGGVRTIALDVVMPVLHGKLGEDGTIQGLLELSGIPYIGCDLQSSVLCMDKALTYLVVAAAGVATPEFSIIGPDDQVDAGRFDFPIFVKPARSGSSFGVSKVTEPDGLAAALATARRFDSRVLIERAVVGNEIGCAVLGNEGELCTGEVDRIALSHGFFKIHQEREPESGSENATFVVPADIPAPAQTLVRDTATLIYRALGCRGLARVDLFLTEDGDVVLNEVNTMPGLTSYSRYPRMMAAAGIPLAALVDRLVSLALTAGDR